MKEKIKKKKLIFTIAVILVVVILVIIVTTNIKNNSDKVANEGYFATTANANSNLVASYIKEGITIGGITGTLEVLDTSDADATEKDISWGKTGYVNGVKITGTRIDTVAQAKEAQQTFTENKILLDDYGNSVKVPAGFKIAEESATSVTGGVVIEDVSAPGKTTDTKGSQFVWIPVGDVISDLNGTTTKIELGRYTFDSNGKETLVQSAENGNWKKEVAIHTYCIELALSSYGNATAKSLENFVIDTLSSGGYYIGRYEAGDATAINTERTDSTSDSNPIVCKAEVYPYNYVTQLQASSLCRSMYSSNNFESDLINSYAWDTAIMFIQTFSGDSNYSVQYGRTTTRAIKKCAESILDYNLDEEDNPLDIRCNIYDMSGNSTEWSTETYSNKSYPCINRGGYCISIEYFSNARIRSTTTSGDMYNSPRIILYL